MSDMLIRTLPHFKLAHANWKISNQALHGMEAAEELRMTM